MDRIYSIYIVKIMNIKLHGDRKEHWKTNEKVKQKQANKNHERRMSPVVQWLRICLVWVPSLFTWNYHNTVNRLCCAALCLVTQSCLLFATPWDVTCQAALSMGILQARILEWVAMSSSRGSSQPRDQTCVSCIAGGIFTTEALVIPWGDQGITCCCC